MKILAFAASTSRNSINKALVQHAAQRLHTEFLPGVEVKLVDLNDYEMPIYSIDREREYGIPQAAQRFFDQIGRVDGLLVSYAEHNGLYTAAFKNIFDWASRIEMKVFQGKPKTALSTSIGRRGGANVLKTALESAPHFGAEVVSSLSIPRFRETFDVERGVLKDDDLAEQLGRALQQLADRLARNGSAP